jgi:hypothetical protein
MNKRRVVQLPSPVPHKSHWRIRNYLLLSNPEEKVDVAKHNSYIQRLIRDIERHHLSTEFEYFRTGFVFGHLGQRGICISVWHWGAWGRTREMFNHAWYTYGRDYKLLKLLNHDEPVFCEFEVRILLQELNFFRETAPKYSGNSTNKSLFRQHVAKLC